MWCPCLGALGESRAQLLSDGGSDSKALDRRQMLRGMTATLSLAVTGCAPAVSSTHREAAQGLAQEVMSVDLHSHPGMTRISRTSMEGHIQRIAKGKLKASLFSAVADGPLLGITPQGRIYATREPRPGELYATTYRQIDEVKRRIASGMLVRIGGQADLETTRVQRLPGAILAVEGGDFLESRLDRVREAYDQGIRSIQLVHYRVNELGDIQTEPPRHGGLTPFGKDVIREMNRLGMIVDLAHATLDAVKGAVEVSSKPMLISHTVVNVPGFSRAVSRAHARLVTERGGVVGVFPVAFGGPGFSGFIDHITRLADAVGIDHVGVGTDMDGIPGTFVTFDDYSEWPSIPAALLARGYGRDDVAKVIGGNFLRVFKEVAAT